MTTTTETVVHVVDDDGSVRTAITRLLSVTGYQARSYESAGEFLMARRDDRAGGCVLLDVNMPGPSGLELYDAMVKNETSLPVIFLTGHGDIFTAVRAMKAGAVDFLTKPVSLDLLMRAVERAIELDQKQRQTVEQSQDLRGCYNSLTAREKQVFAQVTDGKLNKQIAGDLGASERTVKAHRAQVMEKMHVRTVAALVRAADRLKGERQRET
jgi:FixJ family two-component response regulator